MTSERCEGCRFAEQVVGDVDSGRFDCRRYPPVVVSALLDRNIATHNQDSAIGFSTVFPIVDGDDWCGEFKPKTARKKGE